MLEKFERLTTEVKIILGMIIALFIVSFILIFNGNNTSNKKNGKETVNLTVDEGMTKETDEKQTEEETDAPAKKAVSDDAKKNAEKLMKDMSLHDKICQMFIVTPEGLTGVSTATVAGNTTKASIEKNPVGGLVYFQKNINDRDQIKDMIAGTQKFAKDYNNIPLFAGVDEEGGKVSRVASALDDVTKLDSMFSYKDKGTDTARTNAKTIAQSIADVGFNLDFAPVADTFSNSSNDVIGDRCYSDSYEECASLVSNAVKGFADGNVLCTLKHFPGHGDAAGDSHDGAAKSDKTLDELKKEDIVPFEAGIKAGAPFVMVGHITMAEVDNEIASLSKTVITDTLKGELGYDGIVITDALDMDAITSNYKSGEAAVKAVSAGVDMLLMPASLDDAVKGLEDAVKDGKISEDRINESVLKILTLKCDSLK